MYKQFSKTPLLSTSERNEKMNDYFFTKAMKINPLRKNPIPNKKKSKLKNYEKKRKKRSNSLKTEKEIIMMLQTKINNIKFRYPMLKYWKI